jgi:hypothetical protein
MGCWPVSFTDQKTVSDPSAQLGDHTTAMQHAGDKDLAVPALLRGVQSLLLRVNCGRGLVVLSESLVVVGVEADDEVLGHSVSDQRCCAGG